MKKAFLITLVFILWTLCFAEGFHFGYKKTYEKTYKYDDRADIIKCGIITDSMFFIGDYVLIAYTTNVRTKTSVSYTLICPIESQLVDVFNKLEKLDRTQTTNEMFLQKLVNSDTEHFLYVDATHNKNTNYNIENTDFQYIYRALKNPYN